MSLNIVGFFCEDIREEVGRKESFLGVLPDNVNVPPPPEQGRGGFPKLCIYVRIHVEPNWKLQPISLHIQSPDGSIETLGGFETSLIEDQLAQAKKRGSPYVGFLFKAQMMPFPIQYGRFQVFAKVGKKKHLCCVLNVQVDPNAAANASEQPASQSLPAA